jgi:mono/diheme cytochrome c family protein
MRHWLGNILTLAIVVLLVSGAVGFAWMRSAQVTLSDETTDLAVYEPAGTEGAPAEPFDWRGIGEASYRRNCAQCHLDSGRGWDQYPGLGHTGKLWTAPEGREYVIDLHLYGLTSERYRAPMPPMGHMPDVDLAGAINYVLTSFGNEQDMPAGEKMCLPADVAAQRGEDLSPAEVNERRPTVAVSADD